MDNPDHISESLETIFWVHILEFFAADQGWKKIGSGMEKNQIRDEKKSDLGWKNSEHWFYGNFSTHPLAVSPESMTQSEPSRMALATSPASALVGRGFFTIDSSIWVAQMIGFPALQYPFRYYASIRSLPSSVAEAFRPWNILSVMQV
jgi:hypothetical protein